MAYFYYTITAVLLYLISDWILNRIETYYGKRFQYRSVIFFAIILVLSMSLFEMIDRVVGEAPQTASTPKETLATDLDTPESIPMPDQAPIAPELDAQKN